MVVNVSLYIFSIFLNNYTLPKSVEANYLEVKTRRIPKKCKLQDKFLGPLSSPKVRLHFTQNRRDLLLIFKNLPFYNVILPSPISELTQSSIEISSFTHLRKYVKVWSYFLRSVYSWTRIVSVLLPPVCIFLDEDCLHPVSSGLSVYSWMRIVSVLLPPVCIFLDEDCLRPTSSGLFIPGRGLSPSCFLRSVYSWTGIVSVPGRNGEDGDNTGPRTPWINLASWTQFQGYRSFTGLGEGGSSS